LSACGNNHPIVGTWEGAEFNSWVFNTRHGEEYTISLVFRADGTMELTEQWPGGANLVSGIYEVSGNSLIIVWSDGFREIISFNISNSGDSLAFGAWQLTRGSGFNMVILIFAVVLVGILLVVLYFRKRKKAAIPASSGFCSKCGKATESEVIFCGSCGNALVEK